MTEITAFACKRCQHPAESHDDEFVTCAHLGQTDAGWDICDCPGYEEMELIDMPCMEAIQ